MQTHNAYEAAFQDGNTAGLEIFTQNLAKFNRYFCELMQGHSDFTLKMEIHGNGGELVHCRITNDTFDRPPGKTKKPPV